MVLIDKNTQEESVGVRIRNVLFTCLGWVKTLITQKNSERSVGNKLNKTVLTRRCKMSWKSNFIEEVYSLKEDVEFLKKCIRELECDHPIEERYISRKHPFSYALPRYVESCKKCDKVIQYLAPYCDFEKRDIEIKEEQLKALKAKRR